MISSHCFSYSPKFSLTSLRWVNQLDLGEVGKTELLAVCCSRISAGFHRMNSMLIPSTCDTFSWTLLLNCRSHGLQDFKGLELLHESQKAMTSYPKWLDEVTFLQIIPSHISSSLTHFLVLCFKKDKTNTIRKSYPFVPCALTDDTFQWIESSFTAGLVVKKSAVSWITYKPLVDNSLFRAGCWITDFPSLRKVGL